MAEALVAGHICLDIIPELKSGITFTPGRLIEAGPAVLSTGGAVSNTGLALAKLGVTTKLVARVGKDAMGTTVRNFVDSMQPGASESFVDAGTEPTSYTIVMNSMGADRMFIHAPGANATFRASDVSDADLAQVRLLHFGYPPLMQSMYANEGEELVTLFRRAKGLGVTTSLDMSLPDVGSDSGRAPWEAILARVLPFVDIFLPSLEELLYMLDRKAYESLGTTGLDQVSLNEVDKIADRALALGAKMVGIKMGSRGFMLKVGGHPAHMGKAQVSEVAWAGYQVWHPIFDISVAGTTGAGDATIAGFLWGVLQGLDPVKCCQVAAGVGASCCEAADAVSGIQSSAATLERLDGDWKTITLGLDEDWEPALTGYVRTYAPPRD